MILGLNYIAGPGFVPASRRVMLNFAAWNQSRCFKNKLNSRVNSLIDKVHAPQIGQAQKQLNRAYSNVKASAVTSVAFEVASQALRMLPNQDPVTKIAAVVSWGCSLVTTAQTFDQTISLARSGGELNFYLKREEAMKV